MQIIEPLKTKKTITQYLDENKDIKKVGIVFFHGIGDCVQFLYPFDKLKALYPNIHFDILLQKGLDHEVIFPEGILTGIDELKKMIDYDYIFLVHFPVETDPKATKSELCCQLELGITATSGHKKIKDYPNKLIGLHFCNTALPDIINTPKDVAQKIWNEVLEAGFIPIEIHFQHVFHNPKNEKYDFIDCTVRKVKPKMTTLLGLLRNCAGVICAVSGPFHCALSIMPDRVFYLEKDIPLNRFTYLPIPKVNVNNYKDGVIKEWLNMLI